MTDDILGFLAERCKIEKRVNPEYKKMNQETKIKYKEAKEKWINDK